MIKDRIVSAILFFAAAMGLVITGLMARSSQGEPPPVDREEVIFWHFWGGQDRDVVERIAKEFNQSQTQYWVRPVAMPGNNLDTKIFLSITGGDPPDLVNQDDPIVADWAHRGLIDSFEQIAPPTELEQLNADLLPSARRLGMYDDRLFAICNGLDIRALYYNKTVLDQFGLSPPTSIEDLDYIARTISPPGIDEQRRTFGYLPDSRRLWAWGYVFGGDFFDSSSSRVVCQQPEIIAALDWMSQYSEWYGPDTIAAFRQGDQSLPGKAFPLLPLDSNELAGRYVLLMDGQWRTRDIRSFLAERANNGVAAPEFGVCPLPFSPQGRRHAGWVNGNFFVIPQNAKTKSGAWEFIKFWIGYNDPERAAEFSAAGGWIPTTSSVTNSQTFQTYLDDNPLFLKFVELAKSENQFPIPVIPGAPLFKRTIENVAVRKITSPDLDTAELLENAQATVQEQVDRASNIQRGTDE